MFKKRGLFFSTLIIITAIALWLFIQIFQYGFEMFIKGSFESASTDGYVCRIQLYAYRCWIL